MLKKSIILSEHQPIECADWEYLKGLNLSFQQTDYMGVPKYLGIYDGCASYYIGAAWLAQDEATVVVKPKMQNIDFVAMFLAALEVDSEKESDYFSKCYGIQFDEPSITVEQQLNQLTPLLALHYVSLLERLVKCGLKKDYIIRENNLKCKIKGRLLIARHLQKNIFQQRNDRVLCQYQEYTEDIPENRLLKKALLFVDRIINSYESLKKQEVYAKLQFRLYRLKSSFENVSDEIEISQVRKISTNKLFKEYQRALKVAKMVLRRFDYSIQETSKDFHTTPPFWIDMARLYELYVYSQLNSAYPGQIAFQVAGHCRTAVDFIKIDEKLIIDTKYKPHYEDSNRGIIDDIREISGYARDWKILKQLGVKKGDEEEVKCLIIYPEPITFDVKQDFTEEEKAEIKNDKCNVASLFCEKIIDQSSVIPCFRNFYKVSIKLPEITGKTSKIEITNQNSAAVKKSATSNG